MLTLAVPLLFEAGARAAVEPAEIARLQIPMQSLAPGIELHLPRTTHRDLIDHLGLPAMSTADKIQFDALSMNASMGVCACGSAESATVHSMPIGQTSLKDAASRRFAISVVSFDLAMRIFSDLAQQMAKEPITIFDGCYARAQQTAYKLEQRGILVGKIMAKGSFKIFTNRVKRGSVEWRFHVAPVIVIDDGQERSLWVLDPSLFAEPVPITAWLSVLTQAPRARLDDVFLTNRFVFHPNQKDMLMTNWRPQDMKTAKTLLHDLLFQQEQ